MHDATATTDGYLNMMRRSSTGRLKMEAKHWGASVQAAGCNAGGLGREAGGRPGSAPPSRTGSPARLRPPSALAQPKGPQPKVPCIPVDHLNSHHSIVHMQAVCDVALRCSVTPLLVGSNACGHA